ncbi:YIP1 family protein [Paenibacillus sp. S-38]|uniref:YIP1 family protein n=1 Tax=Paenibacillus sp. S-38 TaxID=3416710 RepID=UPI003CF650EB
MRPHPARRILLTVLAVLLAAVLLQPGRTSAYTPYNTNYKDSYGQLIWTQSAYNPGGALGRDLFIPDPKKPGALVHSPLKGPQDVFIDAKDRIYIADTGNNRIVQLDPDGKFVRMIEVKESPLKGPQGLFVNKDGDIYVADTGNKRVIRLDAEGKLIREFPRPESKFLPASFKYDPVKLVVDKRGFLYITSLGGYQGLLQLDPEGGFQGFFGSNRTPFSLIDAFKRFVYTREMYQREISKLPGSIASAAMDGDGLIYTVSKEVETGQIKKLNIAGLDMLAQKTEFSDEKISLPFGETPFREWGEDTPVQLNDLTVDHDGNITAIDTKKRVVSQYDGSGSLLFFWWADAEVSAEKLGVIQSPTAIASSSKNDLYILDGENNLLQKFELSEFGRLVHQANRLTQDGRYAESETPWAEVHRLNAFYTPAILGLAKAAYGRGDYERAQALFKAAGQGQGYSDAFWQNRLLWFQQRFGLLMNVLIFGSLALYVLNRLTKHASWRRSRSTGTPGGSGLAGQLKHAFYILKHPIDGFAALRYENKGGFLSSFILFVLALASYCVMEGGISFLYNPDVLLDLGLGTAIVQFFVIWLGWIVANYLISAIYRGEGRFRDVVYGSTYALFPFVLIGLPLTLLSQIMTLNEGAVYRFFYFGLFVWVGLLLFWKVQSMQNYSVGETSVNVSLSVFTMSVCGVLLFITFGLTKELYDFFYSVFQEVTVR